VSHPLIARAAEREVRQAAAFRDAAAALTGESLRADFEVEQQNAPSLSQAGRTYFVKRSGKPAQERRKTRDLEHLGSALLRHCRDKGEGLALPDDAGMLELLDYQVRVKAARADDPETRGIGRIDLLGLIDGNRLAVVRMRFLSPEASRCGVGDTPLHVLLDGLAHTAIASACIDDIAREVSERFGREMSTEPPVLLLLTSPRYWELCRKRSVQKGAAWIKELTRLAEEIHDETRVPVHYMSLRLQGDPGWTYDEEGPLLQGPPLLMDAWEPGADRVKPKPRPRVRAEAPAEQIVEADMSRPSRAYALSDEYDAGDRIRHPVLGEGVVQGVAGEGKIRVRFDESEKVLVHRRAVSA